MRGSERAACRVTKAAETSLSVWGVAVQNVGSRGWRDPVSMRTAAADPEPVVATWKCGSSIDGCSDLSKESKHLDFLEQLTF